MKRIFLLSLMICSCCVASKAQSYATFSSYHNGMRYEFVVTPTSLESSPAWSEDQDNPPLSPRSAREIAYTYLQKLVSNAEKWNKGEIRLHPMGQKWIYAIEFSAPPPITIDRLGRYGSSFVIIVLMNGETVEAKVTPVKSP